ncbi:MAG: ABC transporter substrate-binding protein [Bacteroidales bacterium]
MYASITYHKKRENCLYGLVAATSILFFLTTLSCKQNSPSQGSEELNSGKSKLAEYQNTTNDLTRSALTITDASGRTNTIPEYADKVICSGAGCLRLLTYLQAQDLIVAVDGIEVRGSPIDARPYAIANPQFKNYPVFGEFRGYDNPELIAGLVPQPHIIFKMQPGGGIDPDILQDKTGIPVITLNYGNMTYNRQALNHTLRLMANVVDKKQRAEEVISFFDGIIQDLKTRTSVASTLTCYIGGLGQSGPHGLQSTDPSFAPFVFLGLTNVASEGIESKQISYLNVSKEQIVLWDPDIIFIDISTLRLGANINALDQLQKDPSFRNLKALKNKQIYGLFPNNSYNQNFEVVLANAYFIGKIIYPDAFSDIDPIEKAEEISCFLNGGPSFGKLNEMFGNTGFTKIVLP